MASVITIAFEGWKAQEAASGKPVLLNEFVFANVPNLDPTKPIDRNEKLPPANQIVHRQAVNKAGLASENAVAYSVTLGADVGDFDFNWIGLLNKESNTVAMITHAPSQKKLKTQNGQQGNVLIRSFLLEFQGAAEETQIKTSAETWQIDFTARLTGIDEMQRLINVDSYGAAAFFDDGFEVTRSGEQFTVKKGLGYVGGLRGRLEQNQILNGLHNTKVYADFSYQGNIVSQWHTAIKITAAATLNNYVDAAGFTHQVFAVASVDASGTVKDLRPMGALSDQELAALEARFKLDLSKKIDKANITHQTGNSTELVVSQQLATTELGKKASTEALNNGLALKFDKAAIVQEPGRWTEIAMSQKAVTDALNEKASNAALTTGLANKFDKTGGEIAGNGVVVELKNTLSGELMLGFTGSDNIQRGWIGFPDARNRLALVNSLTGKALVLTESGKLTYADKEIYSAENTKIDRNGNLKVSGTDALSDYPVGAPIPWPQSTAPTGFLICNGQSFNKTTYPLLATTYPSGVLPDMRDEFIRGSSASRKELSLQGHALQGHGHTFAYNSTPTTTDSPGSGAAMHKDSTTLRATNRVGAPVSLDGYGTVNYSTETRPRNIAFLYIVRAA
ncbi:MAG: phage tail protein [Providencia heimbachae]|nr:phage tail protein [Providencia heimbachae]